MAIRNHRLTPAERNVVWCLAHPRFDADYLEEWINRDDNVFVNAPAALQAMEAKGYYEAVKAFVAMPKDRKEKGPDEERQEDI